jgi:hypothetical protein
MSRASITIRNSQDRSRAALWVAKAPFGTRIDFKAGRRSLPQNDRMWAMLTDIASQIEWHSQKLSTNDWKLLFLDALKREARAVPNLDGNGFVSLGRSSSDLSKQEMGDLLDLIAEFGARHGVVFNDEKARAA